MIENHEQFALRKDPVIALLVEQLFQLKTKDKSNW